MENEKKVWETKEFRDAKKNFQLDKKCHQCGSKKELTPHHITSYKSLIFWKLREVAITELCKQKGFTFTHSALTKTGGFSSSGGYIKVNELITFIKSHPEFKDKATELAKNEYYSFSNIETLCKRCHFATEKGMILCNICKKSIIRYPSVVVLIAKKSMKEDTRNLKEKWMKLRMNLKKE